MKKYEVWYKESFDKAYTCVNVTKASSALGALEIFIAAGFIPVRVLELKGGK